jgi:hypothetical protein
LTKNVSLLRVKDAMTNEIVPALDYTRVHQELHNQYDYELRDKNGRYVSPSRSTYEILRKVQL